MKNFCRPLMTLILIASAHSLVATGASAQVIPPDLPPMIMCYAEADKSWRVGYLYRVKQDGDAIYIAPDGKLTATLNSKGIIQRPTDRPTGVDCYGKTLDELRQMGRVMDFQKSKE